MWLINFFRRFRDRRFARRVAKEDLLMIKRSDTPPPEFSSLVHVDGFPFIPERHLQEPWTVTGSYRVVTDMMREAIDDKKRGRDAAKRITNAIGAPPEPKPKKRRR